MANGTNVVVLVGRLTKDAELRYTNGGSAVCRFSIAVNRRQKSGDQWHDEVSYFDCVLFGKSAESMNQYLSKGRQISLVGELRQNRWEQDGQSRSRVEIFVTSMQLLGEGKNAPQSTQQTQNVQGYQFAGQMPPQTQYDALAPYSQGEFQDDQFRNQYQNPLRRESAFRPAASGNAMYGSGPESFNDDIPF